MPEPTETQITGTIYRPGQAGATPTVAANARLRITPVLATGYAVSSASFTVTSDSNGDVSFYAIAGSYVKIEGPVKGFDTAGGETVQIPVSGPVDIADLITAATVSVEGIIIKGDGTPLSGLFTSLNFTGASVSNVGGVATISFEGAGTGTVTSVGMTVPSFLSVGGSPVTSSGTLALSLANQNANRVFAGPSSGSAAAPTFRALAATDIPDLSATYQPTDSDLTAIAGLSANNDDVLQRKAGAWANRTIAQLKTDLSLSGTNTGDQTLNSLLPTQTGNSGKFLTTDGSSASWASGGGGGSPGGSDTQLQFNDGGSFGGDSGLTWNKTSNVLTLTSTDTTPLVLAITQNSSFIGIGGATSSSPGIGWVNGTGPNGGPILGILTATGSGWANVKVNALIHSSGINLDSINGGWASLNSNESLYLPLSSSDLYLFGSANTTKDLALTHNAAAVAEVNNGTSGQWAKLIAGYYGSGTSATANGITIGTRSSGTPGAGLGAALLFTIDSTTTANRNAAQVAAVWTTATDASRTAELQINIVNNANALANAAKFDLSATANDTGFFLWDANSGTVKRVVVGASDSGGSGFRLLRIPN